MPILHCVLTKEKTILAKQSICEGNFEEIVKLLLEKLSFENDKRTYYHGQYLFHYIIENKIVYICFTDKICQRSKAFLFLNEIRRKFAQHGKCDFHKILSQEMFRYSEDYSNIVIRNGELDELNNISVESSDQILGEKLFIVKYNPEETLRYSNTSSESTKSSNSTILRQEPYLFKFACAVILLVGILIYAIYTMCSFSTPIVVILFICLLSKWRKKDNNV